MILEGHGSDLPYRQVCHDKQKKRTKEEKE